MITAKEIREIRNSEKSLKPEAVLLMWIEHSITKWAYGKMNNDCFYAALYMGNMIYLQDYPSVIETLEQNGFTVTPCGVYHGGDKLIYSITWD